MSGARKTFLGKQDPCHLSLYEIFPDSDLVFSTPLNEDGRHKHIAIEGNAPHLAFLESDFLFRLLETPPDDFRFFGRWAGIDIFDPTDHIQGLQIIYDSLNDPLKEFELLAFVLRRELAALGLKLLPISRFVAMEDGNLLFEDIIPLPPTITNGAIQLPAASIILF